VRLHVEVRADILILRYHVVRPTGVAEAVYQHVESHFRLLELADRYRVMSLDELRGQYHALSALDGAAQDAERVRAALTDYAATFQAEYGVNHWRTVLYGSLAQNDQFSDGGFTVMNVA
jgi:hypothetical protein